MRKTLFALILLLSSSSIEATAQVVEEYLPFHGEPVRQWIYVLDKGEIRKEIGTIRKTPKHLIVSALLRGLSEDQYVSGVVEYEDGQIESTAFHRPWVDEFPVQRSSVAQAKSESLKEELESLEAKRLSLEAQKAEIERQHAESSGAAALIEAEQQREALVKNLQEVEGMLEKLRLENVEKNSQFN